MFLLKLLFFSKECASILLIIMTTFKLKKKTQKNHLINIYYSLYISKHSSHQV